MKAPKILVAEDVDPGYDLAGITAGLLELVPTDAVAGLGSIVYRAAGSLPRRDRGRSTRSQGRKVFLRSSLGFYQPGHAGAPPYIEIYADNLLQLVPRGLRRVRAVQEMTVAHVLFHEIGHHVHKTKTRKFADVEEEAEHWRRHLADVAFDSRYWARHRLAIPAVVVAAASPGVVGLWGLELIEKHYGWVLLSLPIVVPYALYLLCRRLASRLVRRASQKSSSTTKNAPSSAPREELTTPAPPLGMTRMKPPP